MTHLKTNISQGTLNLSRNRSQRRLIAILDNQNSPNPTSNEMNGLPLSQIDKFYIKWGKDYNEIHN